MNSNDVINRINWAAESEPARVSPAKVVGPETRRENLSIVYLAPSEEASCSHASVPHQDYPVHPGPSRPAGESGGFVPLRLSSDTSPHEPTIPILHKRWKPFVYSGAECFVV